MRLLLSLLAFILMLNLPAHAASLSGEDEQAFQAVITGQIEAFRKDEGARAYSYAAPAIRQLFPTPEAFMKMVRQGYQPVYRPKSYNFGSASISASGRPIQKVTVLGPDGVTYEAIYTMERQPDGTWQIIGCAIVRAPDTGA